ncbi:MAG: hypothetical protein AAGA68_27020 [Pseudomonadota bacterium]
MPVKPRQFCREEIPGVLASHPEGLTTYMLLRKLREIEPWGADYVHVEAACVELFDAGVVASSGTRWLPVVEASA